MEPAQLRAISPSMLIAALVLFCLPWVNVSCRTPDGNAVEISQTGLQAALGQSTKSIRGPDGEVRIADSLMDGPEGLDGADAFPGMAQTEDDVEGAPLLLLYALALVAGAICGFVVPGDRARMAGVGACGAAATALLILQLAAGFPLTRDIPAGMVDRAQLDVSYSLWFWMSLLVTLAAPAVVLWEYNLRRPREALIWPEDEP